MMGGSIRRKDIGGTPVWEFCRGSRSILLWRVPAPLPALKTSTGFVLVQFQKHQPALHAAKAAIEIRFFLTQGC